jgi:hypothetical protein
MRVENSVGAILYVAGFGSAAGATVEDFEALWLDSTGEKYRWKDVNTHFPTS